MPLNNDFIPEDHVQVIEYLDKNLSGEEKLQIVTFKHSELIQLHHTLGAWMRNTWGLWHGSKLKKHMESLGFYHADDMSQGLINAYYHKLNDLNFDLREFAKYCTEYYLKDISIDDLLD